MNEVEKNLLDRLGPGQKLSRAALPDTRVVYLVWERGHAVVCFGQDGVWMDLAAMAFDNDDAALDAWISARTEDEVIARGSTEAGSAPTFTHEELKEIWNALAQYCENCEGLDDGRTNAPDAAESALEKLDAYIARSA